MRRAMKNARWAANLSQGHRRVIPEKRLSPIPPPPHTPKVDTGTVASCRQKGSPQRRLVLCLSCLQWTSNNWACLKFIQMKTEDLHEESTYLVLGEKSGSA